MRKVSILVAALLLVSSFAFGQTMDWSMEADASATWGAQLDEMATGFKNDASFTISTTLKEEATEEFGEGDVYGWIEVEDVVVELDGDTGTGFAVGRGDITGQIIFGAAYLEVYSSHVAAPNEASNFSKIAQNIVPFAGALSGATWSTAGVAVGTSADMFSIELGVGSATPWDDTAAATQNEYGMSIDAEVTPTDMVTIGIVSNMHFGNTASSDGNLGQAGNPASVGIGLEYAMPMGDMSLAPQAGVDLVFVEDAAEDMLMDVEVGFGVNLTWADLGADEDDETIFGTEDEVTSGVGLGVSYLMDAVDADNTNNSMGVKLGLYEDGGDDGLLPVVGGAFILNYNSDMETDQADLGFGVELNADLGTLAPFFGFKMAMLDLNEEVLAETDDLMFLNVGTDINVIPNTTFTIEYASGDLSNDDDGTWGDTYNAQADLTSLTNNAAKAGELSIETSISF